MELAIPGPQGSFRLDSIAHHLSRRLAPRAAPDRGRLPLRDALAERGYLLAHATGGMAINVLLWLWHGILSPGAGDAPPEQRERILARFFEVLDRDLEDARAGYYPEELVFRFPLASYAKAAPGLALEAARMLRRKRRGDFETLPASADDPRYPPYYRRTFHWQSDGWFSDRSARLYDPSVEILFIGIADVMRRRAIPPIARVTRGLSAPRVLDLACGTGRFLLQLHRAIPAARLAGLDLSAPYLARARETLSGAGASADLLAENAEAVPLPDGGFDAVASVFLFHELPAGARRNVAREALRLLRPGGVFVICDSAQLADSSEVGFYLEAFPRIYHEPYHKGYIRDDLGEMLREVGFTGVTTEPWFLSKVVAGRRPSPR